MSPLSLTIAFLDVGQGDSTVVLLPIAEEDVVSAILVDCPRGPGVTADYLLAAKVSHLPWVALTHTDEDHLGGMNELLRNFLDLRGARLGRVDYNHDTFDIGADKRRAVLLRALLELTVRRCYDQPDNGPRCGDQICPAPGVQIEILHPREHELKAAQLARDPNNASLLIRISYAGRRVLLPGDLMGRGWEAVVARRTDLKADFIRFPHHGAWYDSVSGQPGLPDVLGLIAPEIVVFSVGSTNIHGHPHPKSVELIRSLPGTHFAHTQPTPHSSDDAGAPWPGQFSDRGSVEIVVDHSGYRVFILDQDGTRTEIQL